MELLNNLLETIEIGEVKTFGQISVVPLIHRSEGLVDYRTLPDVLGGEKVRISEVNDGGSVPELAFVNDSEDYVLLLDGEELIGAKQNRVLNTTLMVRPKSSMRIPVSCTEQGRWSYSSHNFEDSGVVMPYRSRYNKKQSIDEALSSRGDYRSDQRKVWEDVSAMSDSAGVHSQTGAMKDVYEDRSQTLEQYVSALQPNSDEAGMVVLLSGEVAGLELFSKKSAFQSLAPKLIKSYAMSALLDNPKTSKKNLKETPESFISNIRDISGEQYKSLGEGWDYRFAGDSVSGSALSYEGELIHAAFYNTNTAMSTSRSRRR